VAVGDFNGDGKQGLAVTKGLNTVGVHLGNGDGTFQSPIIYATGSTPLFHGGGGFQHRRQGRPRRGQ
jgi:hypothetical protein